MHERSAKILTSAVQEFIRTGEPISSGWLYRRYDFGIKPAMIRLELEKLAEEGFLEQPYRSAGRVPSDRGLEFYVQGLLAAEEPGSDLGQIGRLFMKQAWENFMESFSEELELLGVASEEQSGSIYKNGIENLFENLEWETPEEAKRVVRDFAELDERLQGVKYKLRKSKEPQVFIGEKSPVTKSRELAVVAEDFKIDGGDILLLAIGPKRMNYKKTLNIFKSLKTLSRN